jgi:hypothetical protein
MKIHYYEYNRKSYDDLGAFFTTLEEQERKSSVLIDSQYLTKKEINGILKQISENHRFEIEIFINSSNNKKPVLAIGDGGGPNLDLLKDVYSIPFVKIVIKEVGDALVKEFVKRLFQNLNQKKTKGFENKYSEILLAKNLDSPVKYVYNSYLSVKENQRAHALMYEHFNNLGI